MTATLHIRAREASTHAVTRQARARALRTNRHLNACEIRAEPLPEARDDSSGTSRRSQELRLSACHSPEIRRLWLTIPISTASPAA